MRNACCFDALSRMNCIYAPNECASFVAFAADSDASLDANRTMEKKKKLRKKYARAVISNAIESRIADARDTYTLNSFLYLIDRFRPWIHTPGFLESGRPCYSSIENRCRALYELSVACRHWIREPFDWRATGRSSFRTAFGSLLRHLLATHTVPGFMDQATD